MADATEVPLAAVTGATGFIGRRLIPALALAGWRVRLLMRRDPVMPEWRDLKPQIVAGALADERALERLVEGAHAVIHVAGLIKAARRSEFFAVNRDQAAALARVTVRVAPQAHLVHVSTLAAREPQLSDYAASKRAGEEAVLKIAGRHATVLRPPAVYGPGDRETLVFFELAGHRFIPLAGLPKARAAMIHADDLARLIAVLARQAPDGQVLAAADGRPGGYSYREIFGGAARAVGNAHPRFFQAPALALRGVALVGDIARGFGHAAMLNSQKLRELRHPDWSVTEPECARPPGWVPRFTLDAGFADAVAWYRAAGWLSAANGPGSR